ncbi:hypothetical protein ACFWA6_18250 [Streptomyces sp. NPDC060020]|uniref:hypothetical protein n=1 Tax=Streptomyces sp. NPDC060020 TaxID=3347038 RepID=UPI0036AA8645
MSALNRVRRQPSIQALPARWRPVYVKAGSEPDGIAPVCSDPDHEEVDGGVYDCCGELVIEVPDPHLAEYLAALLTADRGEGR